MRRRFINDEESSDDRKRREHKRLDALIGYCEAPACRRQTLLAYFGETSEPCGNCDGCLDPVALMDGKIEAQKILSAVHRTGQRFGAHHIADVLEGKETERIVGLNHNLLPTFGVGKDRPRGEWLSLVRQLVSAGFLVLDVAGHGGISISLKGRALLKGEESFRYRRDVMPRGATRRDRAPRPLRPQAAGSADDALLARLKALRLALSSARRVPAYVVMADRSLVEMAARKPRTPEEFGTIYGIGETKIAQFAEVFLRVINAE